MKRLFRAGVEALLLFDLRKAYHRVWDVGIAAEQDIERPIVFYANHHSFFDGHLVWLVAHRIMRRETMTWMQEWRRFPFLGPAGALDFPSNDARARSATIRSTRRRFATNPRSALILFPEGRIHPSEEGVLPFQNDGLHRLARLLPTARWCPFAIYSSWRNGDRPDAFLATGSPRDHIDGTEEQRLLSLVDEMPERSLRPTSLLLSGRSSADERWDFRMLAPLFRRS